MIRKIKQAANLISNMGLRYVAYRTAFALRKKSGLLKKAFPTHPATISVITLNEWRQTAKPFFFASKEDVTTPVQPSDALKAEAALIMAGKLRLFSSAVYDLGRDYDWVTNPDTGFKYDLNTHWTDVNDYSKEAGDIKFVWEKSRFSFLYTLIRYNHHFDEDVSKFIFAEIENWIDHNPVNMGPNYKCSQEISLRVLNWTFALYYYKNSPTLTAPLFQKIMNSIYRQMQHVYSNINFSRIAVRNNHAITETLALYLVGLLYPFLPEANKWKAKGKQWFEQEIAYQIYPDGTFLQFSMNYHRVVVQLLTWAFQLAGLNGEKFNATVADRARASYRFLSACMNEADGNLPNYGANDGALFFPLNDADFRDYRPQLQSLALAVGEPTFSGTSEDQYWFGLSNNRQHAKLSSGTSAFADGGYYLLRENDALTFLRCGNHKDRPSQADNLHLDLWANGQNIMRDGGSYKYNTDEKTIRYFFGTASHNTVMLGDYDQMQKGNRFIWYYWSGPANGQWSETNEYFEFTGSIHAFKHVAENILHKRTVRKYKKQLRWEITDVIESAVSLPITQIWNPAPQFHQQFTISAVDAQGAVIQPMPQQGWYSGKYGSKEAIEQITFTGPEKTIHTIIQSK